jgi:hypothetical protein
MSLTSPPFFSNEFHEEYQGLFLFTSLKIQEFGISSWQRKLPVDPCLEDRQARLDIDSDQNHLVLVNSVLDIDLHWVLENDLGI